MRAIITFLLLIFSASLFSNETDFKFRKLTIDNGLIHTDATYVIPDSSGFMWICTLGGLQRFDGYQLKSYINLTNELKKAQINRVFKAYISGTYLWLGTDFGLQCFDLLHEKFIPVNDNEITNSRFPSSLNSLIVDKNNRIWAGFSNNFKMYTFLLQNDTIQLHRFKTPNNLKDIRQINSLYYDNDKNILFTAQKGLIQIVINGEKYERIDNISKNYIGNFYFDEFNNELWSINHKYLTCLHFAKSESSKTLTLTQTLNWELSSFSDKIDGATSLIVKNDDLWLGTARDGLILVKNFRIKINSEVRFFKSTDFYNSLSSDEINYLYIDKNGCLWATTWLGGINICDLQKKPFGYLGLSTSNDENKLSGKSVRAIAEDNDGNIWIGTHRNGLNFWDKKSGKVTIIKYLWNCPYSMSDLIRCIAISNKNELFITIAEGILRFSISEKRFIGIIKSNADENVNLLGPIYELKFDKFNNLWAPSWNNGINQIVFKDNGKYSINHFRTQPKSPLKITSERVNSVYYDSIKNCVIATTDNGLSRLILDDLGNVSRVIRYQKTLKQKDAFSSSYLWPIEKAADGSYWVGSLGGGLNHVQLTDSINDDSLGIYHATTYNLSNGAPSNDIESLQIDNNGFIWLGSKGISRFDPSNNEFWNLDVDDGLQGNGFKIGSSLKGNDGMLYFGGVNGLNYFFPNQIIKNKNLSKIVLTELIVNHTDIEPGKIFNRSVLLTKSLNYCDQITLSHLQNNFSIGFASLHFTNSMKHRYRYRLNGYDKEWIEIGSKYRYANYSNLKFGTYKFEVDGTNNDGIWSNLPATLAITIKPPWWQTLWALILYIFAFIAISGSIFYYLLWATKMKNDMRLMELEKQKDAEINQTKLQFFTNISHEFKTPLTLIASPLERLKDEPNLEIEKRMSFYETMTLNVNRLLSLVNEIMDFRRAETNNYKLRLTNNNIGDTLKTIIQSFTSMFTQKSIAYNLRISPSIASFAFDQEIIEKIVSNLISNALRYTNEGSIEVGVEMWNDDHTNRFKHSFTVTSEASHEQYIAIIVSDTGIGISEESLPKIFDRFFMVDSSKEARHQGSGIGLALIRSLTLLHHGSITVNSERNKGTEFIIRLPYQKDFEGQLEVSQSEIYKLETENDDKNGRISSSSELETLSMQIGIRDETILIVEDNDQLRSFLEEAFESNFNVLSATNGVEALELLELNMVDAVVSDVMMPEMDGLELCRQIRNNVSFCHLPIILLTARNTTEDKIEGLEHGADIYIEKPFNMKFLKLSIVNLLESRMAIKLKYQQDIFSESNQLARNSSDASFLDKLHKIIYDNISDPNLRIEYICREIGMSKSNFSNKMKVLTGMTPIEYIRVIKMKKSAMLLAEGKNVNEVIDEIGFNSRSYFSKSFKAQFGAPPSEFVSGLKKEQIKRGL